MGLLRPVERLVKQGASAGGAGSGTAPAQCWADTGGAWLAAMPYGAAGAAGPAGARGALAPLPRPLLDVVEETRRATTCPVESRQATCRPTGGSPPGRWART